jgi:hypothetical protein
MHRPTVDFPDPDSPTKLNVSPASMSNDTPETACTGAKDFRKKPPFTAKCFTRFFTDKVGMPFCAAPPGADVVAGALIVRRP